MVALGLGIAGAPASKSQTLGEGSNPAMAINDPDRYAWQLFLDLNTDAGTGDGRVVWETWKNFGNGADVFLPDGSAPPPWPANEPAAPRSLGFAKPALRSGLRPLDFRKVPHWLALRIPAVVFIQSKMKRLNQGSQHVIGKRVVFFAGQRCYWWRMWS